MLTKQELLVTAMQKLILEAIHFRNTGHGKQFLTIAIENAQDTINFVLRDKIPSTILK